MTRKLELGRALNPSVKIPDDSNATIPASKELKASHQTASLPPQNRSIRVGQWRLTFYNMYEASAGVGWTCVLLIAMLPS